MEIENLDFKREDLKDLLGEIPEAMRTSKICKGLNLSDGRTDSALIYWNYTARRFDDWGL